jgi:hypothetical protein
MTIEANLGRVVSEHKELPQSDPIPITHFNEVALTYYQSIKPPDKTYKTPLHNATRLKAVMYDLIAVHFPGAVHGAGKDTIISPSVFQFFATIDPYTPYDQLFNLEGKRVKSKVNNDRILALHEVSKVLLSDTL